MGWYFMAVHAANCGKKFLTKVRFVVWYLQRMGTDFLST